MKKILLLLIPCLGFILLSFDAKKKSSVENSKCFKSQFALVPEGEVVVDGTSSFVNEFYISKTEVANYQYNSFVQSVAASGNSELLAKVKVDAENWEKVCSNHPLVVSYVNSPDYSLHPAVNVSYEGAVAYCQWLTDRANASAPDGVTYEYRLPTREEWVRAAEGKYHRLDYAWGGPAVKNAKGCALCQYNRSTEPRALFERTSYTSPAKSYSPNSIGVYNMNGNAAEMISEKGIAVGGSWASKADEVKNLSTMHYDGSSPLIGFRPVLVIKKKI